MATPWFESDSLERGAKLTMKKEDIEQCDRLMQVINGKEARLAELKASKKNRQPQSSIESLKSNIQKKSILVLDEVGQCFKELSNLSDAEHDLKMLLCSCEQAKLDVNSGSGSLLVSSGTTRESSQKLVDGLNDINGGDIDANSASSAVESVADLVKLGERTHLTAVRCATRGELVKTEY